jgi:hypothetical protein
MLMLLLKLTAVKLSSKRHVTSCKKLEGLLESHFWHWCNLLEGQACNPILATNLDVWGCKNPPPDTVTCVQMRLSTRAS